MEKWYAKHQGTVWLLTLVAGTFIYAFATFASINYVDAKHESVKEVLDEIKLDVRDTREKVYQLNGERLK